MAERKSEWFDWLKALIIAFALAFIVRMFLFSPIVVDGPSMLPTLHDRDQMIVNKFTYRISEPDRFDIVVFHATTQKDFIKRIIGLPGEHIMVKDETLFVNGEEVEELFLAERMEEMESHQVLTRDFDLKSLPGGHETIPDGYVLVLGDNRNDSTDSRSLGLISMDQIVGKASLIYWPFNRMQIVKE